MSESESPPLLLSVGADVTGSGIHLDLMGKTSIELSPSAAADLIAAIGRALGLKSPESEDIADLIGHRQSKTTSPKKLPAVKFDGKVVRRAEADGEMLFHADDCGRCVSICNIAKVCADLLAEHTRDIPGPHDKPHLYLTAIGAAELSKLSKDYDLPKAFRAWLKQDFAKAETLQPHTHLP